MSGTKNAGVVAPRDCSLSVRQAIQQLSAKVVGLESTPTFAGLALTGTIVLKEQAAADADIAAYGQIWCKTAAPNTLWFVNDVGTEIRIAPQDLQTTATPTFARQILTDTCLIAAGANFLRVTGLQIDGTAMTGTLRGAYIDVSNGSTAATGTIRAMELKARTEAPGDTGNNVTVLEGLSISADSKDHSVTTMRAAEFILDGSTGGTITEAVGLRIANNLQANKATASYGLQIYRDSFNYTYDITLSLGGHITGDSYVSQDYRVTGSPTFAGLTITGCSVLGLNSAVFQPAAGGDSTTFFQVLDADGGTPILNVDTTNERVGIGTDSPGSLLHINSAGIVSTTLLTLESDINNTNEYNEILFKVVGGQNYGAIRSCIGGTAGDSYMSLFTTTDGGTLVRQVTIQHDGRVGFGTYNPETLLEMVSTAPYVTLYNITEEDTDGGGESRIIGKREDGAGTGTAAGQIEISHDGSGANDQLGKIILSVNTGAGLAQALEIGSDLLATFGGAVNITTIAAEGSDVDKFLVDSTGVIKYRTGAQVLSDIGGQASGSYITALTGEVTASGPGSVAATITANAVTYAKMQDVSATDKLLGRVTAGAGDVEEIACTAAGRAILDDVDASAQRTTLGLAIGTNVQAWDAQLDDLATITATAAGIDSHLGGHSDTVLWSEIDKTTSSIADITTKNHTDLTAGDGSDHSFIDQSVVIAGTPTFAGIVIADGGTIGQAAGPLLTFDDTSNYLEITGCKVGIGRADPSVLLDLYGGSLWMRQAGIAHPITDVAEANVHWACNVGQAGVGGIAQYGVTEGNNNPFSIIGLFGPADPTDTTAAVAILGGKSDGGTGWGALAAAETVFQISNYTTPLVTILGTGYVGLGTITPACTLDIDGPFRVMGSFAPLTGVGIEYHWFNDIGYMFAYDRDATIYKEFRFYADPIAFYDGSDVLVATMVDAKVGIGAGASSPGCLLHLNQVLGAPSDLGDFDNYQFVIQGGPTVGQPTGMLFSSSIDTYGGSAIVHYDTGGGGLGDLVFYTKQAATAVPPVEVMRLSSGGNVGIGLTVPTGQLHIDQSSASGAKPVLRLDQGDIDDSFIDFIGTSAADGTRSISSDVTEDSAKFGAIRVEINGVTKWIRIYDDES